MLSVPEGFELPSDNHINKTQESELLCGRWTLIKMTVISEKAIYDDDLNNFLILDCNSNSWKVIEDDELHSSGTWQLKNSTLEFTSKEGNFDVQINEQQSNRLVLVYPDLICVYTK